MKNHKKSKRMPNAVSVVIIVLAVCTFVVVGSSQHADAAETTSVVTQESPTKPVAGYWLDVPTLKKQKTVCVFGVQVHNFTPFSAVNVTFTDKKGNPVLGPIYVGTTDATGYVRSGYELNDSESLTTGDGRLVGTAYDANAADDFDVTVACAA
jgi:L-2-hydroxyglutarate oxidase LhgO